MTLGKAPALPANTRQWQQSLTAVNTLAYYGSEIILAEKSFMIQTTGEKETQIEKKV